LLLFSSYDKSKPGFPDLSKKIKGNKENKAKKIDSDRF